MGGRGWGGNITAWDWQHKNVDGWGGSNPAPGGYTFTYDQLGRFTGTGPETEPGEFSWYSDYGEFGEYGITYDKHGNILTLKRNIGKPANDYEYSYDGNRLVELTDFGYPYSAYTYDANGNMTRDGREGLDLSYNMLNLVSQVKDGTTDAIRAEYQWLADGTKLSAVNAAGNGYDYVGSLIYSRLGGGTAATRTLESAPFSGGRIVKTSSGYEVNYFLTDHLGSPRVVFSQDMTDLQRNDFYPFGLRIDGLQLGNNRYLYNGKESQVSLGSGYLDYGARFYDANSVIFNRLDRFAEGYYPNTPYGYVLGNPIKHIDINGDTTRVYTETTSNYGLGHAWLSTGEGENMTVYTYGRYNGTYKGEDGSANSIAPGPGVLMRLTGEDAINYQNKKAANNYSVFNITDVKDEDVAGILDKMFNSSTTMPDAGDFKNNPSARVIDEYSFFNNNCTTMVSDALNQAGSKALQIPTYYHNAQGVPISNGVRNERFVAPFSLQNHLRRTIK